MLAHAAWVMLLALASIGAGPPVLRSGHVAHPLRLSAGQMQALLAERSGPSIDASAAALVDRPSNTVLFAKNADMPLPMGSTTKLMTVLKAAEALTLDQVVTVPEAALVGGTSMGLQKGERVSVRALLYGALLPSGNDAAMVLALNAAASEDAFVAQMNEQATAWGLRNTHFANPTGFDAPNQASSALDLAALGRRVLDDPLFASIVRQPEATIEGYTLKNTNDLLTTFAGAYGVKTGTTDAAGQVLIGAARRSYGDGVTGDGAITGDAIMVVMNSPDRYAEARRLLDFYFGHWLWLDPGLRRDVLNRVTAPDGVIYLLHTPAQPLFLNRWQASQLRTFRRIDLDEAKQPGGVYEVWLGDQKLLETPIQFIRQ